MPTFIRLPYVRVLRPWRCVERVEQIPVGKLVRAGVHCVLIDRDNTCVPRDASKAPDEVVAWLNDVRAAGISTCVVSNNFHTREVERSAAELGSAVVHHAMKPAPFAVCRAMRLMDVTKGETLLIGDQRFTDVAAGNLAGVRTVLVRPQSERDLWYTLILRKIERRVFGERVYEGGERHGG